MGLHDPPESICILRLSSLGDVTHVVPVIRAIREQWPATRITWIIGKPEHRLMGDIEDVEFIVFDKKGGWDAVKGLRRALRSRRFDVLLHMQVAARANLLSRLIRAPVRIGWDRARSRDLHHHFIRQEVASVPFQHQVQGFLEFARALGIAVETPRWDLPVSAEAEAWVDAQLPDDRPLLVISSCSSRPRRNWRAEYLAEVADHAIRAAGMQVVLTGGPSDIERTTAARLEACMAEPCLNLVGKDTLGQLKAMLRRAALVIAPDSGPSHIASALGTPVIGLHAATWSRRSGPYNSLELCVDRFEAAALRYRGKPAEELRWGARIEDDGVMDLIRPEDVIERFEAWRARAGGRV